MGKGKFYLTHHAAIILRDIYALSIKQWGQKTANKYMAELYAAIKKAAARPEIGRLRAHRSAPFLIIPAGQHFIIYDCLEWGIVVLTLLHQHRDVERIIAKMEPAFIAELFSLRNRRKG
jgi:plasmid stabilization system protein ParE